MSSLPQPDTSARSRNFIARRDLGWCLVANRWGEANRVRRFFSIVSRLGDGVFWYALMGAMVVLDGRHGLIAAAHMAAAGIVALTLYKALKRWTRRPRPFAADGRITAWIAPLDEFSFPSGHTLHAVSFTLVALAYYPWLAIALIPFSACIAVSRVVLGMHYPSDVLAATGIGCALAGTTLYLF